MLRSGRRGAVRVRHFQSSLQNKHEYVTHTAISVEKKSLSSLIIRFESVNQRVMDQEEKRKMTAITIIKMNETETKRFWGVQERLLTIPLSEEQILRTIGGIHLDA